MSLETIVVPSGHGVLWWIAEDSAEAQEWANDLSEKGAVIQKIEAQEDGRYDVLFSLEKAAANEILGYSVEVCEWLDLDTDEEG